jgi:hypothetical protein
MSVMGRALGIDIALHSRFSKNGARLFLEDLIFADPE